MLPAACRHAACLLPWCRPLPPCRLLPAGGVHACACAAAPRAWHQESLLRWAPPEAAAAAAHPSSRAEFPHPARRLGHLPLYALGVSVGGGFVLKLPQYIKVGRAADSSVLPCLFVCCTFADACSRAPNALPIRPLLKPLCPTRPADGRHPVRGAGPQARHIRNPQVHQIRCAGLLLPSFYDARPGLGAPPPCRRFLACSVLAVFCFGFEEALPRAPPPHPPHPPTCPAPNQQASRPPSL